MPTTGRPPPGRRLAFADRMREYARDDSHGYSQRPPSGRWGPDFDCSSLVYQAASDAGYAVGAGGERVRFTGTMLKDFERAGFQILPFANVGLSDLQVGDILLNLALHAEVYVGDGESVGATGSEDGGYAGEAGDQTGHEIEEHPVATFDRGWDYVLRPPDDEQQGGDDETMPMNYPMQGGQQWQQPQGGMYPQGGAMRPMGGYNGYPQGNLGQMNGYAQAGNGYPQAGGYPQGGADLPFVMGIEGARGRRGMPNGREALFDEDKPLMYVVGYDQQGSVNDIHVYQFEECSEQMPQHLSPLMRGPEGMAMGTQQAGQYVTREEFEQLREMLTNAEPAPQDAGGAAKQQPARGGRAG